MFLPVTGCQPASWLSWTFRVASPPSSPPFYHQPVYQQQGGTVTNVRSPTGSPLTQLFDLTIPTLGWVQPFASWAVGGDVVLDLNQSETYALLITGCSGTVTVHDLVAHHLPGKFLQAANNQGMTVNNVNVMPAVSGRYLSVNRDGINAGGGSLQVSNCTVLYCGDDGIVAQGTSWGQVMPCSHVGSTFIVQPATTINPYPPICIAGQQITLVDVNTLSASTRESATIIGNPIFTQQPDKSYWITYTYSNPTPGFDFLLNACNAPLRALAYNPTYSQSGGSIQFCTVAGNRGLGIVSRALNIGISQCIVSDTYECGIQAGGGMVSDYPWWGEGAPPDHLAIQQCSLTRCGSDPWIATKGAIEIAVAQSSVGDNPFNPCDYYLNPVYSTAGDVILDVTLSNNTIREFPRAGIFAANVGGPSGIRIITNSFITSGPLDLCHPEYGFGIAVETCGKGLVQGNQFVNCSGTFWQHQSPNVVFIP